MSVAMSAKRLRVILLIAMVLIIAAVSSGFLFAHKRLTGYAAEISQLTADAGSGNKSIEILTALESRLENEKPSIEAARSIVADNATFAEQVVNDVTRIAAQSGVTITSLEYVESSATTPTSTSAPVTTPPPTTPPATAPVQPGTATPAGVTKKSISVTIESPLEYTKLLNFIKNIESNTLKLQIASVTMQKETGNNVGTQTFSIGAYVR